MSKAPAVDYALRIIELFSETQNEIGIADICNSLGINKNAASRVLESLLEYNWVYLSDSVQKKYRFTLKPFSLVSKCTPQYALAEIAKPDLQRLNGQGLAFLEIDGHVVEKTLAPGEQLKVNTGNVAAFESSVRYNIETVKGFKNVLFGGEGLFLTVLTGPGRVWLQTISMPEFAQKIIPFLPTPSSGN